MDIGWIKLYRKVFENPDWLVKPFDKSHAWLDLILLANWDTTPFAKRGDFVTTQLWISGRWGWSRGKVRRFLDVLKTRQQIDTKQDNEKTVITIRNYSRYQEGDSQTVQQTDIKRTLLKKIRSKEERNKSFTVIKKQPSCPLVTGLKEKYPLGHKECVEYINSSEEERSIKFINKAKQFQILHKILRAGWDFPDLDKILTQVERKYGSNAWDFSTLASWLEKQGGINAKNKTNYN